MVQKTIVDQKIQSLTQAEHFKTKSCLNTLSNLSDCYTQGSKSLQYKTNKLSKTEQLLTISETKKEINKYKQFCHTSEQSKSVPTVDCFLFLSQTHKQ